MDSQEYETASDYKEDFASDNEPPVEKIVEKKLVVRGNFKIYKRILRLGHRGVEKPARFDVVQVRFREISSEPVLTDESSFAEVKPVSLVKIKEAVDQIRQEPLQKVQLGISCLSDNLVTAFSTMKKGEVAFVEFEEIVRDTETKERRLHKRSFFLLEYAAGVTVIDLFTDKRIFKVIAKKSSGSSRVEPSDKIKCSVGLLSSDLQPLIEQDFPELMSLDKVIAKLPPPLSSLKDFESAVRGMKEGEVSFFEFSPELCGWKEELPQATGEIKTYDLEYTTRVNRLYLRVEVGQIFPVTDIFLDGSTLKFVEQKGYTNAKPDPLSLIFFDYSIEVNSRTIASTFPEKETSPSCDDSEDSCIKNGFHCGYLSEYTFSKALQRSLQLMRKGEKATVEVIHFKHIGYGEDFASIKEFLNKSVGIAGDTFQPETLRELDVKIVYRVQMRFFAEGRNNFTLSLEEKENHIRRKRGVAEKLITQKEHKKALKVLKTIRGLCITGSFDEDKATLQRFLKPVVLNSSLCYWKLGDWQEMRKAAREALEIEPSNTKAIYRLCVAEFKSLNFEEALRVAGLAGEHSAELSELKIEIERKLRETHKREKEIYKNILR